MYAKKKGKGTRCGTVRTIIIALGQLQKDTEKNGVNRNWPAASFFLHFINLICVLLYVLQINGSHGRADMLAAVINYVKAHGSGFIIFCTIKCSHIEKWIEKDESSSVSFIYTRHSCNNIIFCTQLKLPRLDLFLGYIFEAIFEWKSQLFAIEMTGSDQFERPVNDYSVRKLVKQDSRQDSFSCLENCAFGFKQGIEKPKNG